MGNRTWSPTAYCSRFLFMLGSYFWGSEELWNVQHKEILSCDLPCHLHWLIGPKGLQIIYQGAQPWYSTRLCARTILGGKSKFFPQDITYFTLHEKDLSGRWRRGANLGFILMLMLMRLETSQSGQEQQYCCWSSRPTHASDKIMLFRRWKSREHA